MHHCFNLIKLTPIVRLDLKMPDFDFQLHRKNVKQIKPRFLFKKHYTKLTSSQRESPSHLNFKTHSNILRIFALRDTMTASRFKRILIIRSCFYFYHFSCSKIVFQFLLMHWFGKCSGGSHEVFIVL